MKNFTYLLITLFIFNLFGCSSYIGVEPVFEKSPEYNRTAIKKIAVMPKINNVSSEDNNYILDYFENQIKGLFRNNIISHIQIAGLINDNGLIEQYEKCCIVKPNSYDKETVMKVAGKLNADAIIQMYITDISVNEKSYLESGAYVDWIFISANLNVCIFNKEKGNIIWKSFSTLYYAGQKYSSSNIGKAYGITNLIIGHKYGISGILPEM